MVCKGGSRGGRPSPNEPPQGPSRSDPPNITLCVCRTLLFPALKRGKGGAGRSKLFPPVNWRRDRHGLYRAHATGVEGAGGPVPELVEELEELMLSASDRSASLPVKMNPCLKQFLQMESTSFSVGTRSPSTSYSW